MEKVVRSNQATYIKVITTYIKVITPKTKLCLQYLAKIHLHLCEEIFHVLVSELFYFNQTGGFLSISIGFKSGPLQNLSFVIFMTFRCGLVM